MKKKSSTLIALVISIVIGLALIAIASLNIYSNNKTDGFGSGNIKVSNCKADNWARKIYICTGDYSSSAGMIGLYDVTVRVMGREYKDGEYISDVYPANGLSIEDSRYFITGAERASVYHNTLWLVLAGAGFLVPLTFGAYFVGLSAKSSRNKV